MSYVECDGIWHIVARIADEVAVTVCDLRIPARCTSGSKSGLRSAAAAKAG